MEMKCASNPPSLELSTQPIHNNDDDDSSDDEDEAWRDTLQTHRLLLVRRIRFSRISAALLSNYVIDAEENELLLNPFYLPTEQQRISQLIDYVFRKDVTCYNKFVKVIGRYYPDIYQQITKQDPDEAGDDGLTIPDAEYEPPRNDLVQLLMQALESMKHENSSLTLDMRRSRQEAEKERQDNEHLRKRVQRYETLDHDMTSLRQEADRLKTENYTICMHVLETKEENGRLRECNIRLKKECDEAKVELQKMESCVAMERTHSGRLRTRLQRGPSERDVVDMRKEIDQLKLKLAQVTQGQMNQTEPGGARSDVIEALQREKDDTIAMYAKALDDLNKQREAVLHADKLCMKFEEEKEQLSLTCAALKSDCAMFKMRRDSVWQQLQEVEKEREMITQERNEAQLLAKVCMQEKAKYRMDIRALEGKYDELKSQLHETEKKLAHGAMVVKKNRAMSQELSCSAVEFLPFYHANMEPTNSPPSLLPSDSANGRLSITSVGSDQVFQRDAFRKRAFNTKHFEKFCSSNKSRTMSCESTTSSSSSSSENRQPQAIVFPGIKLAADYGKEDAQIITVIDKSRFVRKHPVKKRRSSSNEQGALRCRHDNRTSSDGSHVEFSSSSS